MTLDTIIGKMPKLIREPLLNITRPKVYIRSDLYMKVLGPDGRVLEDRGLVCTKVVTTAFCTRIVNTMKASDTSNYIDDFKYHYSGTGTGAASASDTYETITEISATGVTGSEETGDTANVYKSVATITYTGAAAVTEHCICDSASLGEGCNLLDRNVFEAVNVVNGYGILFTYTLTFADA